MSRELETHIELEVLITFNYYPGEPTTREDPGCNEECEIESVIINSPTRHPTSYPSIDILPLSLIHI